MQSSHTHLKHVQEPSEKRRQETLPVYETVILDDTSYNGSPLTVPELAIWNRVPVPHTLFNPIAIIQWQEVII